MFDSDSFILSVALTQMEDWIAFLEDCKGEGCGEPEEMIAFIERQKQIILLTTLERSVQC